MYKLVAVLSAALLCALVRGQGDADVEKMNVFRLPENQVDPLAYDLQFTLNLQTFNFSGVANILVTSKNTDLVTLNLKDLNVTSVLATDVTNNGNKNVTIDRYTYLTNNEQFEIKFTKKFPSNRQLLLTIDYDGNIRDDMTGLYKSSYNDSGVTKWLAVTQFESTYARRAFPCFDEPAYKTTFNISVVRQKGLTALSNMPILRIENGEIQNTEVVYFEKTPLMSSYLVAIYLGEFVPDKNDSKITVYTYKGMKDQTTYVATEAPKHLTVLEKYTDINYMLTKMDLLAIPDFKAGAMENWGINTYRESYLLVSDDSKTKMKIRSSEVVQHEFTHQWFGDLVTCKWWDYLWLNEGFATYFQYFATGMVRTSWSMEELFVVEAFQRALEYDQQPRHPITASVKTPEDISGIFDTISYSKAAAVLRMLKNLVTEDLFKLSLQYYLKNKSYSVAEPSDLFSAFDNVLADYEYGIGNELTVEEFMSNWTLQSGYPVLNIMRNTSSNTFLATQRKFYINEFNETTDKTGAWHIGLTYTTDKSKNFSLAKPSFWTNTVSASTTIPAPKDIIWYIFNIQATGFYRVNYDVDNWMALIKQLNSTPTDIHVLNRAQLIDDAFNLARSGQLDYSVPLHISKYLNNENNTTPWYSAMNGFAYLLERMPRSNEGYADFKSHVSSLAGTIYKKLEDLVANNNTEYKVLSAWETFSKWACSLENKYCVSKAQEYFNKWQANEKIPADIKDAAFCVGVKNSKVPSVFDNMFELYKNTKSISEKSSAESALGCATNRTQLSKLINHILDGPDGPIKENNIKSVVSAVSVTDLGLDVLYDFLSTKINETLKQLSTGEEIVSHIYSTLASKTTSDVGIEKLKQLKDDTTIKPSVRKSFETSYQKVEHNLAWFNSYSNGIIQWTSQYGEKETSPQIKTTSIAPGETTESPVTGQEPKTTPNTPKPSSATSNAYNSLMILQLTVLAVLVKTYIL